MGSRVKATLCICIQYVFNAYIFSIYERLATALAHAYDVIEIRVPNKKNFQFGL